MVDNNSIKLAGDGEWNARKCQSAIAIRWSAAIKPPRKNVQLRKPGAPLRAMRPIGHRSKSAGPSSDTGTAISAEAVQRPSCTV
jgi:hypothetical protein